jgi:hypothetical protein
MTVHLLRVPCRSAPLAALGGREPNGGLPRWAHPLSATTSFPTSLVHRTPLWLQVLLPDAHTRGIAAVLGLALVAIGCNQAPRQDSGLVHERGPVLPSTTSVAAEKSSRPTPAPPRSQRRTIVAGDLKAGTHPSEFPRNASLEPLPFHVKLGEFEIDALPFPNDPNTQPQTAANAEEAGRLCGGKGGRLCTELEWERACRGPEQRSFAAGQPCSSAFDCVSGFGVFSLGSNAEWTASHFGAGSPEESKAVLRGQPTNAPNDQQRCAFRSAPNQTPAAFPFRCCYGPPNAARVPEPSDYAVFESINLSPTRVKELLASDPRTKALTKDLTFFADPEASNTVLSRGAGDRQGFSFSTGPLLWSPTFGARYLVLSGKSGKQLSFVLAYHVFSKDDYALASSFVLEDEVGPVVFAYSPSIRPRLHFSTCWGCPGETGKILFRDNQAMILQP